MIFVIHPRMNHGQHNGYKLPTGVVSSERGYFPTTSKQTSNPGW